ncbi:transcriptional regulator [Actinoplanes lobatus]|uniref:Transcriptional regulator n=1 Tax=Actinoplanes lobatus TaxID=113568 RepID=A0A7W7HGH3_9ACTN|nr:XRE family transcriptional regulator [Actinoplanes lobatus]MBB4750059.1 DNA-binding transcriptional regulator YdaS (Cro superfamily) [Actinoplanes lobatus]GGN74992.1 transcriptional regulator [Actinoplanes lobatus]GIE39053.1 transcriptional regulator [Actinoplanes lobatus]
MNSPLARALHSAGVGIIDVAARLDVDPKTVQRWMTGRMPYPRHRAALVRITGWQPHDLWPTLPRPTEQSAIADEVRIVYPHRSAVPTDVWARLLSRAEHEIDVLAYSALFLAEDVSVPALLRKKARSGVRVRIALGDPDGAQVASRGDEERVGAGMSVRIRTALVSLQPLAAEPGIMLRLHDTVLYNSLCRADDEMLVNSHIYGRPAAHAPVLHLKSTSDAGMVATHTESFERVWGSAKPSKL